jgi:spore germination protein KA
MVKRLVTRKLLNTPDGEIRPVRHVSIGSSLKDNEAMFREIFDNDSFVIFRRFETMDSLKCLLIFVDAMADSKIINNNILGPAMQSCAHGGAGDGDILEHFMEDVIASNEIERLKDVDLLVGSVLYGDTVLIVDGYDEFLLINTKGWKTRAIEEPASERVAKGPREGFIESIIVNMSLIRRKIKNANLKFDVKTLGTSTSTTVSICYIKGVVDPKILEELHRRLDKIDIDGIQGTNYLEEMISDSPLSPFTTTGYTERPDTAVGKLLEGRVVVLVDGSPLVMTLPFIFMEYFQSNEDYYDNYVFSSINRFLRYLAFFLTISVPAIYVSLVTYHQEMVPTPLILSIISAREGVPFPTIVEMFGMLFVFEILREGGIRLPEPVGTAITIVGALVLGQAAVEARFVSAPVIIIVAFTGISAFLVYSMKGAVIVARIVLLLLAGILGLYGYFFGLMGLFIHLMSMRSFGVPYMLNMGSIKGQEIKDTIIRAPWWYMHLRPKLIGQKNPVRNVTAKPGVKK